MKLKRTQRESVERIKERIRAGIYTMEDVACFCGSIESRLITKTDRNGIPHRTVICKKCGLIYASQRMSKDTLAHFYNEEYFPLYASLNCHTEEELYLIQRKQGIELINTLSGYGINPPGLVIDIGCGTGGMLSAFYDMGWEILGIDFSEDLIRYGRAKLGNCLFSGDIFDFESESPADLILLSHIIEHLPDLKGFLIKLKKMIKPQGYIFIITPGIKIWGVRILGVKHYILNMHLYYFSLETLKMVMNSGGFFLENGNESIYALFRDGENIEEQAIVYGDPGLYKFIMFSRIFRPLWLSLWPLWVIKNRFLGWLKK
jgi:2-polyprenyl-3-methyl-5-hydroxy-6-metoxy-1,4-benzoquinol methylase